MVCLKLHPQAPINPINPVIPGLQEYRSLASKSYRSFMITAPPVAARGSLHMCLLLNLPLWSSIPPGFLTSCYSKEWFKGSFHRMHPQNQLLHGKHQVLHGFSSHFPSCVPGQAMSLTVGWAWMNVCQVTTDSFVNAWNSVRELFGKETLLVNNNGRDHHVNICKYWMLTDGLMMNIPLFTIQLMDISWRIYIYIYYIYIYITFFKTIYIYISLIIY